MGLLKNDVGRPSNKTILIRRILKIIGVVAFVIVCYILGYYIGSKGDMPSRKTSNNNEVSKNTTDKDGWYTPSGNLKTLDVYLAEYNSYSYIRPEKVDEYDEIAKPKITKVGKYNCSTNDCKILKQETNDSKIVIIKDTNYIAYNYDKNIAKKIDFGKYEGKVNYIEKSNCDGLGDICISSRKSGNQEYYTIEVFSDIGPSTLGIINSNFEAIKMASLEDEEDFWNSLIAVTYFKNGDFMFIEGNRYAKYNHETKKIEYSDYYNSVELIDEKGYIVVVDNDNYLKVLDLKGKKLAKLAKISKDMTIHTALSGWFEQDKKEGVYVVVQDPKVTCDDLKGNIKEDAGCNSEYGTADLGYEYYYIPSTNETGKIATYIGGYAKPVLYLYPTKDNTKVTVSFAKPELLTTTYPKYNNEWTVTANKNGDLHDLNGKYYYGLYWEEKGSTKVDFKEGFYVTKDNAIEFLEEKLDKIGLNEKEANEFIMYWLPILEKNEKSLVYFELTDSRQMFNKLNINPQPDSMLRMAIHVKKVSKKTNIKEQKLTHFERTGFAAVEWGGVIH